MLALRRKASQRTVAVTFAKLVNKRERDPDLNRALYLPVVVLPAATHAIACGRDGYWYSTINTIVQFADSSWCNSIVLIYPGWPKSDIPLPRLPDLH